VDVNDLMILFVINLRQGGGYVFPAVFVCFCLFISRITQKAVDEL